MTKGRATLVDELRSWLADPQPTTFPYDAVVAEYQRCGKHFVSEPALETLAAARETAATSADATLARFLEVALDKQDGRYDYPTYLGLCLLPIPSLDDPSEHADRTLQGRDRLVVQLAGDLLGFELAALNGQSSLLPEMRPDVRTARKRCEHGMRVALPALRRLGNVGAVSADDPQLAAAELITEIQRGLTSDERRALALSMLPVYVLHDEYLFIRVLQMFEATFALLACDFKWAVEALTRRDAAAATRHVVSAEATLHESAPLFSLLGTMQVESFRSFREFTDGASAIQSHSYKLMESLCRTPDPERLDSPAYTSVPEVRERVVAGIVTLDDAVERGREEGWLDARAETELAAAMRAFSKTLKRWRQTHYRLAERMLGDGRAGTGHTAGPPYLAAVRCVDVFRSIPNADGP